MFLLFADVSRDLFSRMNGGEIIGVVAVGGGILIGIVSVVAAQWRKVRLAEIEAALKQQMLDKGLSIAEIEQVIHLSREPNETEEKAADPAPTDVPSLVKFLAEHELSGEDIERILRALATDPHGRDISLADPAARAGFAERSAMIKNMVEHEMSGEDIERVLRAYPQGTPQREVVMPRT